MLDNLVRATMARQANNKRHSLAFFLHIRYLFEIPPQHSEID